MSEHSIVWRKTISCCVLSSLILASGCGGGTGSLSGTITYQGQPLRMGTVSVVGGDGIIRAGTIQDDGTYTVTDVATGSVKIAVTSQDPSEQKVAAKGPSGEVANHSNDGLKWFAIPDKYGDFEQSGLTFPLQRGTNGFSIEL